MESKKINYKKPTMQVVEIQYQDHLLSNTYDPQEPGPGAREQSSNWDNED
jgi:hypothetical protein